MAVETGAKTPLIDPFIEEFLYHEGTPAAIKSITTSGLDKKSALLSPARHAELAEGFWLSPYEGNGYGEAMLRVKKEAVKPFIETREGAGGYREYLVPFEHFDKISPTEFEQIK